MGLTWPTLVENWQLQCCGEPFGIGDEVAWTLLLRPACSRTSS